MSNSQRQRSRAVAFSLFAAVVFIGTTPALMDAQTPNVCALVDAAEVLRATGRTDQLKRGPQVQDPTEIPRHAAGCHFVGVLFVLDTGFTAQRFAAVRQRLEKNTNMFKIQSVSGVGDEAYYEWDSRPGNYRSVVLTFRSGNKRMSIEEQTQSDSVEIVKKWLLPIAKTAASKVK